MTESLKFFKIDETSVYRDGYIYSFYRDLDPSKPSADSPQWLLLSMFTQESERLPHTTRRLKFYKNDESSVIRNGYTYVFYRELDPAKSSEDFEWRMSYHCPVSANNQESCRARIHTTGEWIVDERGKEYQWGTFKNCEHTHELEQQVSVRKNHDVVSQLHAVIEKCQFKGQSPSGFRGALRSMTANSLGIKSALFFEKAQNSSQIQKSNSVPTSLVDDQNQYQYDSLDESAMYDDRNECKLDVHDETIIRKTSAHNNRKENHCESSKNGVQGNSRAKACMDAQFKKKRQLNISRKRDVDEEKRYKCNVCHYATNDKYDLTKHLRTHTGERPYKCEKCNYAAADWHTLVRHERTHSEERPYKCRLCQFASGRSDSLKQHMRRHKKPHATNSKKNAAHNMLMSGKNV
ncbi:zinc-finger double domain-containing protein [Ditylenchus destructor]|nr:zinc-finger double domain-containing protein [Ditylenchus destructor]